MSTKRFGQPIGRSVANDQTSSSTFVCVAADKANVTFGSQSPLLNAGVVELAHELVVFLFVGAKCGVPKLYNALFFKSVCQIAVMVHQQELSNLLREHVFHVRPSHERLRETQEVWTLGGDPRGPTVGRSTLNNKAKATFGSGVSKLGCRLENTNRGCVRESRHGECSSQDDPQCASSLRTNQALERPCSPCVARPVPNPLECQKMPQGDKGRKMSPVGEGVKATILSVGVCLRCTDKVGDVLVPGSHGQGRELTCTG